MLKWQVFAWAVCLTAISPTEINECPFRVKKETLSIKGEEAEGLSLICDCEFDKLKIRKSRAIELPDCISPTEIQIIKTALPVFPEQILAYSQLENLSLRFTGLNHIPSEISNLNALVELDLRGNNIRELPPGLNHLKRIDLRFNEISREEQESIRTRYPDVNIYFSSPCNCH